MIAPIWVSVLFIVLTVLTMSFASLIFRKAIFSSSLTEENKFRYSRVIGLLGRLWILGIAVLGVMDVFVDFSSFPPKIILAIIPPFILVVWMSRSKAFQQLLPSFPILFLYFLQFFRVIVELVLFELWKKGLIPQSMTFAGRNFDILVGLSAPLVGWMLYYKKILPDKTALIWNILGLLILTNVVVTGILSTPTPLRVLFEDHANIAIGHFPFVWLPTVLVPIAYMLHITAIRYYFAKSSK